jgi:hypothetical protein
MATFRIVVAVFFAATFLTSSASAFNDLCGPRDSPIDCQNSQKALEIRRQQAEAAGQDKAQFILDINKARAQFWATYPDKPGAAKAREEFANLLFYKDFYYLRLMLIGSQGRDLTARRGPDFIAHILDLSVGLQAVDGGIRQSAKPEFFEWVSAIQTKLFEDLPSNSTDRAAVQGFTSAFLLGEKFWKALAAGEKKYQAYLIERDWWEFDEVHRIPVGKTAADSPRKRREELQAEEARQEELRAVTRVKQNVCISDDLTTEWRNPSAGEKMESLKRLLIQTLRERANTPGYDQKRWIAVDSRYYPAWTPDTSLVRPALVSTIPGGSCGAGAHLEILVLTP